MFRTLFGWGTAAVAALVAACEEGPRTVPGGYRSPATWSVFVDATARGPLYLEVRGAPFAVENQDVPARVAAMMSGALPERPFRFTTRREEAPIPSVRVVAAFNAPQGMAPEVLCAGRAESEALPPGRVTLHAVLCDRERLLASVRGWADRVEGVDDRRLRRLLRQAVRDLIGGPQR